MTIDQVEGNEPLHENFGTQLGNEIDEVSGIYFGVSLACAYVVFEVFFNKRHGMQGAFHLFC